jgi:hypothetical protein
VKKGAHHEASRDLAELILYASLALRIGQNAIQLTTGESWKAMKARLRRPVGKPDAPLPLPIRDWHETLILQYPLPDQRSFRLRP